MERMTRWNGKKWVLPQGRVWREIADRMATYENTGLEPEKLNDRMYELAYIENGEIVRGGIKADILTVERWLRENTEHYSVNPYIIVPASEDAVTKEELFAELEAMFGGAKK